VFCTRAILSAFGPPTAGYRRDCENLTVVARALAEDGGTAHV
jgi:hypothetical protein